MFTRLLNAWRRSRGSNDSPQGLAVPASPADVAGMSALADQLIRAVASAHDFALPVSTLAEKRRLMGFLEVMRQTDYPALSAWSPIVYTAAWGHARIELAKLLDGKAS